MVRSYFNKLSVRKKVTFVIIAAALLFFSIVGTLVYVKVRSYAYEKNKENLTTELALLSTKFVGETTKAKEVLGFISSGFETSVRRGGVVNDSAVVSLLNAFSPKMSNKILVASVQDSMSRKTYYALDGAKATLANGDISEGLSASDLTFNSQQPLIFNKKGSYIQYFEKKDAGKRSAAFGVLLPVQKIFDEYKDVASVILVNDENTVIYSNVKDLSSASLSDFITNFKGNGSSLSSFLSSKKYVDIKNEKYIAACNDALIDGSGLKLVVLEHKQDVFSGLTLFFAFLLFGLFAIGIGYLLITAILNRLFQPITSSVDVLKSVANGHISNDLKMTKGYDDELGEMATSINSLIDSLNETARFATEIGEGNLNSEFKPSSENDKLGIALLGMQQSLLKAREIEESQKVLSRKSQWANEGMAKFAEILRSNHDNLKEMSFNVVKNLVKYVDAIQGGIFVLNDEDEDGNYLEMTACFAYDRRKLQQKRIELGEGLVGRCFFESQSIILREVPDDYLEITSGLGKESPRNLLLVPLKLNEDVNGVIEIASFNEFEDFQIQFIEKIAESISSTITSVRINERTTALLERSQAQAELMAAQEEEMRQNLEELQTTQEELEKRAKENDSMNKALEKEKYLLDALLANIPDFIYFKDEECRFIRVSESMAPLFKVQSTSELIGKSDFDFHGAEHANKSYNEEMEIIRTGKKIIDEVVRERWDDGREQWVSSTKMPLVAADGRIVGTFGISKVITNIKKMELELQAQNEELKSSMSTMEKANVDAINIKAMYTNIIDNLPLKVFVKDYSGKMVIVNSAVAHAHNKSAAELIGKSDFDFYDYDTAKEIYDAELEIINGHEKSYVHEEDFDGTTKILKTTKMPFFIDTIQEKGLLGVQVDVSEFAKIKENHKS